MPVFELFKQGDIPWKTVRRRLVVYHASHGEFTPPVNLEKTLVHMKIADSY
jgi:hypothetical protein